MRRCLSALAVLVFMLAVASAGCQPPDKEAPKTEGPAAAAPTE